MVTQHEQAAIVAQANARILAAGRYQRDRARRDRAHARWAMNCRENPDRVVSLAVPGQKVCLSEDALPATGNPEHNTATPFTVTRVKGIGGDQMHELQSPTGATHKWFRASDLRPATTSPHVAAAAREQQQDADVPTMDPRRDVPMQATETDAADQLLSDARRIAADEKCSLAAALSRAAARNPDKVSAYRLATNSGPRNPLAAPAVLSLSDRAADVERRVTQARAGQQLITRAQQIQKTTQCRWSDAMSAASAELPEIAGVYLGR